MARKKATPADPAPELAVIPLDHIRPSPVNPRKTFDEVALAQLAASIREKGVLEPILVRPLKLKLAPGKMGGKAGWFREEWNERGEPVSHFDFYKTEEDAAAAPPAYELVAGERRWRASKMAGRYAIPALVGDLSDKAAAEVRVIENDQREDVPPLEQAEGYRTLIDMGDDPASIASKIGRPEKYVVARLQLMGLADPLKDDLRAGKLPFGHAHLLARVPEAAQLAALKRNGVYDYLDRAVAVSRLREFLRDSFLNDLSAAPWKKDDADLVPEAGACKTCPKRSTANPTLFDELLDGVKVKPGRDFCGDAGCYDRKREAFIELQVRKVADETGAEAVRVTTDYFARDKEILTRDAYEVLDKKALKDAKPGEVKTAVVVDGADGEGVGRIVKVRVRKAAPARSGESEYDRKRKAAEARAKIGKVAARAAIGEVADKMAARAEAAALLPLLRQVAATIADSAGSDACRMVVKRRGLTGGPHDTRGPVIALALELSEVPDLLGLLGELAAAKRAWTWGNPNFGGNPSKEEKAFWAAFGVDQKKLMQEAQDAAKEQKAAKKNAAKKKAVGEAVRTCRVCGCTDADCSGCVEKTGSPCSWVEGEADLCSACAGDPADRPGPLVCGPVGSCKLTLVDGMPDAVLDALDAKAVRTLGQLAAEFNADAAAANLEMPQRNRLVAHFVSRHGLKKQESAKAAAAIVAHLTLSPAGADE